MRLGTQRLAWVELVRVAGAFGVALLHVLVSTQLTVPLGLARRSAYAVAGIVCGRWAVPGFFMVSGYLLMDPARAFGWAHARRHAARMLGVLASFGVLFALMEETWTAMADGTALGSELLARAVADVLCARSWDHLWYVYAIIPVYLLVPALRVLRDRVGKKGFAWFTASLVTCVLVVPTLAQLARAVGGSEVWTQPEGLPALCANAADGLACFCVGACARRMRSTRVCVAVGLVSLAVMLGVSLSSLMREQGDAGYIFLQGSCFACAYGACVLCTCRLLLGARTVGARSCLARLGRDSFGVYVLHPVFVHTVLLFADPLLLPPVLFELVFLAFVLTASLVCTRVLRCLPGIGRLL